MQENPLGSLTRHKRNALMAFLILLGAIIWWGMSSLMHHHFSTQYAASASIHDWRLEVASLAMIWASLIVIFAASIASWILGMRLRDALRMHRFMDESRALLDTAEQLDRD